MRDSNARSKDRGYDRSGGSGHKYNAHPTEDISRSPYAQRDYQDFLYEKTVRESQRRTEDDYDSQIQLLENDKVALIKRLNMVLVELDQSTQEKNDINKQILDHYKVSDDLQRKLEKTNTLTNTLSRNLQEDLKYERELNQKFKSEINKYDDVQGNLLSEVKENEGVVQYAREEAHKIESHLLQRKEELRYLEVEFQDSLLKIKNLNREIDELRASEADSQGESMRIKEEMTALEEERNDLIFRMNDLTTKYEAYVATMTREREEMKSAHKRHEKLIGTKGLFNLFESFLERQKNIGFGILRRRTREDGEEENALFRMVGAIGKMEHRGKEQAFKKWKSVGMNWHHQEFYKENFILATQYNKLTQVCWNGWRKAYQNSIDSGNQKAESVLVLAKLSFGTEDRSLYKKFKQWKGLYKYYTDREALMKRIMDRRSKNEMRDTLTKWVSFTRTSQEREKVEGFVKDNTNFMFTNKVFNDWKRNANTQVDFKVANKAAELKDKLRLNKRDKYIANASLTTETMAMKEKDSVLREAFEALKFNKQEEKREKTVNELNIERPKRMEHEDNLEFLKLSTNEEDKNKAVKFVGNMFRRGLSSYFQQWRRFNNKYNNSILILKKLINNNRSKAPLQSSFYKWKRSTDNIHQEHKLQELGKGETEMENLTKYVDDLDNRIEFNSNHFGIQKHSKVQRIINQAARRSMVRRFREWASAALFLARAEKGGDLLKQRISRHKSWNGFRRLNQQVKNAIKGERYVRRYELVLGKTENSMKKDTFKSWRIFAREQREIKELIKRRVLRHYRSRLLYGFNQWREVIKATTTEDIAAENDMVTHSNSGLRSDMNHINKSIKKQAHRQRATNENLGQQGKRVLSKFMNRMLNFNGHRAFYRWRDYLKKGQAYEHMVRIMVLRRERNVFREFYDKLRDYEYYKKMATTRDKMEALTMNKRHYKAKSSARLDSMNNNLEDIRYRAECLEKTKDLHQDRLGKMIDYMGYRNEFATKISNLRLIFNEWRNTIEHEKDMISRVSRIAERAIQKDFYAKTRATYVNLANAHNTEKHLQKASNAIKKYFVKNYFDKWREIGLQHATIVLQEFQMESNNQVNMAVESKCATRKLVAVKSTRKNTDNKLRRYFKGWKFMAKMLKSRRIKTALCKDNVDYQRKQAGIEKWHLRMLSTIDQRMKAAKGKRHLNNYKLRQFLNLWEQVHHSRRTLPLTLARANNRMNLKLKLHSICLLNKNKHVKDLNDRQNKEKGVEEIVSTLNNRLHANKMSTYNQLMYFSKYRETSKKELRRCIMRCLNRKLKTYFDKWSSFLMKNNNMAYHINEGPKVMEKYEMERKVDSLQNLLKSENYPMNEVAKELEEKEGNKNSLLRWTICRWMDLGKPEQRRSDAITKWKKWISMRNRIERYCKLSQMRMKRSPEQNSLYWAFHKWAKLPASIVKPILNYKKKQLVNRIMDEEKENMSIANNTKKMAKSLAHLQDVCQKLNQDHKKGKKVCLAVVAKLLRRSRRSAFQIWKDALLKKKTRSLVYDMRDLKDQEDETEDILDKYDNVNQDLLVENEDLRQSSLDGIEIANAIQKLTHEREQLSHDLSNRTTTIKKILDENTQLTIRFTQFRELITKFNELLRAPIPEKP